MLQNLNAPNSGSNPRPFGFKYLAPFWWIIALALPVATVGLIGMLEFAGLGILILLPLGLMGGEVFVIRSITGTTGYRVWCCFAYAFYFVCTGLISALLFAMFYYPFVESFNDFDESTTYDTFAELQDDLRVQIMPFPTIGKVACNKFRASFQNIEKYEILGETSPSKLYEMLYETSIKDKQLDEDGDGEGETEACWFELETGSSPFEIKNAQPLKNLAMSGFGNDIAEDSGVLRLSGRIDDFHTEIEVNYSSWKYRIHMSRPIRTGPL